MELLIVGISLTLVGCVWFAINQYIKEHYVKVAEWASLNTEFEELSEHAVDIEDKLIVAEAEIEGLKKSRNEDKAIIKVLRNTTSAADQWLKDLVAEIRGLKQELCYPEVPIDDVFINSAAEWVSERAVHALEWIAENKPKCTLFDINKATVTDIAAEIPKCGRATAEELKKFAAECIEERYPSEEEDADAHPGDSKENN